MKKSILFLIAFIPIMAKTQLNSGLGVGYDTYGRAIASWSIGYTAAKIIEVQGEVRPSLTRSIYMNNYIGGRLGLDLLNPDQDGLSVILGGGYFYDLRSEDKKSWNKCYWATYVKSIIMITDNGGMYVDLLYLNNSLQASIGIHFLFTNREHLH